MALGPAHLAAHPLAPASAFLPPKPWSSGPAGGWTQQMRFSPPSSQTRAPLRGLWPAGPQRSAHRPAGTPTAVRGPHSPVGLGQEASKTPISGSDQPFLLNRRAACLGAAWVACVQACRPRAARATAPPAAALRYSDFLDAVDAGKV